MSSNKLLLFCLLFMIITFKPMFLSAQKPMPKDSLTEEKLKLHSPRKATMYSAILPGLGQVYNKKYWKVPVIYAGFGALTYSYLFSDAKYSKYMNEYVLRLANDSLHYDPELTVKYSTDNILELKNYYQRNRELSIIGFVVLYALNIIDATVDGHLYSFDISDDLSMNMTPYLTPTYNNRFNGGIQLTFSPNWNNKFTKKPTLKL